MITTKTGDKGNSTIFGKKIPKDGKLINCWGAIDELSAVLSVAEKMDIRIINDCERIISILFKISGYLAGFNSPRLIHEIKFMENQIISLENDLGQVKSFLKAGDDLNIWINWARCVARRVEREIVALVNSNEIPGLNVNLIVYFNRLSDYLFMLSRKYG